nr:hypothetical protein [Tanacetum cinerariifolium]
MNQNVFEPNPCYEPDSSSFDQYHSSQSFVTRQLPQRSNEDIRLEMAKLIKSNRIFLNDNVFSHEEASMEVLLAKEIIFKLIQAWDEKQIKSCSLPELLPQLLNDSRTINEMLKQREQAANLAVHQEQEEQADDEEMLQSTEKFMKDIQTFLEKFSRYPFGVMPKVLSIAWERFFDIKYAFTDEQYQPEEIKELMCKLLEDVRNIRKELAEYINSPSWNSPTLYDNDEEYFIEYKGYLEKSSDAITPVLPIEELEYSLSMRDEHLNTIPKTKSDEVIKSSVKNLVPIPSEYEVTFDNESECDVPVKDESSPVFITFSNPIFDCIDDFTSSDDELLSNEDMDPHYFNAESDLIESLLNRDTLFNSSPKFDYLEEFSGKLMPPGSESNDYGSEGDIHFLEELLGNNTPPISENESSNFDHHDDPSFSRPPLEPPDVEIFFEPDSSVLTTNVVKGIS